MDEREEEKVFSIWVNWEDRVLSFTEEDGFQERQFQTNEEKFRFVIERADVGFKIQ